MSQWGVDVERFAGNGLLALGLQMLESTHVVEPVGQLDEHHAHIGDHGEKHLADIFSLTILAVGKLDFVDLGDALNDVGDLVAKSFFDLFVGRGCVFDGVMQQCGGDGRGIELHLGQDFGNLKGMNDVWLAGGALLAIVVLDAELPCLADQGDVLIGAVGLDLA